MTTQQKPAAKFSASTVKAALGHLVTVWWLDAPDQTGVLVSIFGGYGLLTRDDRGVRIVYIDGHEQVKRIGKRVV